MACLRYSFILLGILFIQQAYAEQVTVDSCLQANFEETVSHKAKPFGLLNNSLTINKEKCIITVHSERYKYLKKEWKIDVCREPIHIKYGTGAVDVFKREGSCFDSKSSFCKSYDTLMKMIEDDGLIFAEGERDNINSIHGKFYCASLLIKSYLKQGKIFSRFRHYNNFFEQKDTASNFAAEPVKGTFIEEVKSKQDVLENAIDNVDKSEKTE